MPCYLFTYHGFGTCSRPTSQRHTRGKGILPAQRPHGGALPRQLEAKGVCFDERVQQLMIEELSPHVSTSNCAVFHRDKRTHVPVLFVGGIDRSWEIFA